MSGYVVWLTGDRGRMDALAEALREGLAGTAPAVDVLTAEAVEDKLCSDEPRGADFRDMVVRRLGWLCRVLARNGGAAVAVAASPRRGIREEIRLAGSEVVEVLVHGVMPRGYEPPARPDVEATPSEAPALVVRKVRGVLAGRGIVPGPAHVYTEEEEAALLRRLKRFGGA
jgi:hypothetical protein